MLSGIRKSGRPMRLLSVAIVALSLLPCAHARPAAVDGTPVCMHGSPPQAIRSIETELAGVPARLRIPLRVSMPPIVLWHGFGPPADEAAMEAMLPLDEVPAVKVYLGLPMFGRRAPADPEELARRQREDLASGVFEPVVIGAARELPRVVEALRHQGCMTAEQHIGLFGFSAGGAAVLYALAERDVVVDAAVILNASTGLATSVAAYERAAQVSYVWTPAARALARRSDAVMRAADIARGSPPPALRIVHGADDTLLDERGARRLHDALAAHYSGDDSARLDFRRVPSLAHTPRDAAEVAAVREVAGAWFLRFLRDADAPGPRASMRR